VKLPRDVSGPRAIKALRRLGFEIEHQKGSHVRLSRGHLRVTIPNHRALDPKTLQTIMRQAQITLGEFLDVLH
jgi:predicted RNA binding protein YcfA (HicA-like mRNA interferase family)